jgi:hypothetical protein
VGRVAPPQLARRARPARVAAPPAPGVGAGAGAGAGTQGVQQSARRLLSYCACVLCIALHPPPANSSPPAPPADPQPLGARCGAAPRPCVCGQHGRRAGAGAGPRKHDAGGRRVAARRAPVAESSSQLGDPHAAASPALPTASIGCPPTFLRKARELPLFTLHEHVNTLAPSVDGRLWALLHNLGNSSLAEVSWRGGSSPHRSGSHAVTPAHPVSHRNPRYPWPPLPSLSPPTHTHPPGRRWTWPAAGRCRGWRGWASRRTAWCSGGSICWPWTPAAARWRRWSPARAQSPASGT